MVIQLRSTAEIVGANSQYSRVQHPSYEIELQDVEGNVCFILGAYLLTQVKASPSIRDSHPSTPSPCRHHRVIWAYSLCFVVEHVYPD